MPERGKPLRKLGFLTIGRFDETDPGPGHEQTLAMIERAEELADALYAHAGFQRADEVAFALPFTFDEDDYLQIVTDIAEKLGPKLGWTRDVG